MSRDNDAKARSPTTTVKSVHAFPLRKTALKPVMQVSSRLGAAVQMRSAYATDMLTPRPLHCVQGVSALTSTFQPLSK